MYRLFGQNLTNYLLLNENENQNSDYRSRISQVLRGLADYDLYKSWEREKPLLFREVNNLVFEIERRSVDYHSFQAFTRDLWGYGYDAIHDGSFSTEIVEEQIKVINMCLGTQYWVDLGM